MPLSLHCALGAILVLLPQLASAQHARRGDGLYGRFAGDLAIEGAVGGGIGDLSNGPAGTLNGEVHLRYLDAAGPWAAVQWSPQDSSALLLGIEVRPMFPGFFLVGWSFERPFLDRLLQSLAMELGVMWSPWSSSFGTGLVVGGSCEMPLAPPLRQPLEVGLRLVGRYLRGLASDVAGPARDVHGWSLAMMLSVTLRVHTGLASWPLAPRR